MSTLRRMTLNPRGTMGPCNQRVEDGSKRCPTSLNTDQSHFGGFRIQVGSFSDCSGPQRAART